MTGLLADPSGRCVGLKAALSRAALHDAAAALWISERYGLESPAREDNGWG